MKVSIWQQFSSNHSNGFTVVGEFETKEAAEKAALRFKKMLEDIYLQGIDYGDTEALQAEIELGEEFEIEWTSHLDWIFAEEYEHVLQFDQYVAISDHHGNTWQGMMYIDQIMSKMAIAAHGEEDEASDNLIGVELSCLALNIDTANTIFAELKLYFDAVRTEKVEVNSAPWKQFYSSHKHEIMMNPDAWYGYIHQEGEKLTFDHLKFGTLGTGLPALIAYLTDKGCSEITYVIKEVPMKELYDGDEW